jgi:hypothetical protein
MLNPSVRSGSIGITFTDALPWSFVRGDASVDHYIVSRPRPRLVIGRLIGRNGHRFFRSIQKASTEIDILPH